jgi:D-inositol-3-phosphate glycosyltransferase
MKISIVAQVENWRGGIQQYSQNYAEALFKKADICAVGYKSYFPLWLYPGEKANITRQHREWKEPVPVHNILKYYSLLSAYQAFRIIQKEFKADVVDIQWCSVFHAPILIPLVLLLKHFSGASVFLTVHNVLPHENRMIDKSLCGMIYRLADRLVVHSMGMKQDLVDIFGTPSDKVAVIPHGICFEDSSRISREEARAKLGITEERVLLFFGLVRKYKGVEHLLNAFGQVKDEFNVGLLIAGDFVEDREKFDEIIERFGMKDRVYIHARYIEDTEVSLFFSAADILVQPYQNFTGQSGVPPTAYLHSRPVIASRVGGLPEIVIENQTGLLVEPGNTEEIAGAIRFFLKDPIKIEEYGAKGKRFLETELSWDSIADKMLDVYKGQIAPSSAGNESPRLEEK